MKSSMIQSITDYIIECPLLKDGVFRVDALGDETIEYVIETDIGDPIIKRYINGDTLRQYLFRFGSREYYSMDRLQNIENSEFYEEFANWLEEKSNAKDFPVLPDKCSPIEFNILTPGYIFDSQMRTARYQIQLQLIFYKEK